MPKADHSTAEPPRCTRYTISDLAKEFEITARTIRFYEDEGLLAPARHGQTRVYGERDRVRLMLIVRGRRCGFSVNEIGEMLDLYDAPEGEVGQIQYVLAKLAERCAALQSQRQDIDEMLETLRLAESRVHAALQHRKGL